MDNSFESVLEDYPHYEVFTIIQSIGSTLKKYSLNPEKLCKLCLTKTIDADDVFCYKCKADYTLSEVIILVQEIITNTYKHESKKTDNIITLFKKYVSYPYEKLLLTYFSCNLFDYNSNHFNCLHNKYDDEHLCSHVIDLINRISNVHYDMYLVKCPIQYMELLVKKGVDVNYMFGKQTVFEILLSGYLNDYGNDRVKNRINKLVILGANVNIVLPTKRIEIRPDKIEKIKYLKGIGVIVE